MTVVERSFRNWPDKTFNKKYRFIENEIKKRAHEREKERENEGERKREK